MMMQQCSTKFKEYRTPIKI